jgi:outer membrane protein assembly factor BamD
LKSSDFKLKYTKAKEYYEKKDYMRASTLLEDVSPFYKGTQDAEHILYLIADCYYKNKEYETAINYYRSYNNNFPKGENAIECKYMIGYCYYLDSPDVKLDQTSTYKAIEAFQLFTETFPSSERVSEATKLMTQLQEKLVYKSLLNVKLYYKLGNYQGNNYKSSIIVANNTLRDYPYSKYREELSFYILKSKYMQAIKSIDKKKAERYRETMDEYYTFASEYPEGKYKKEAEKIFNDSRKSIKE